MMAAYRCIADVANLAAVRRFVQGAARQYCADEDFLYDLALAVDEAVTNIILYGYQGAPGEILIEVNAQADGVAVILTDQASQFDPTSAPAPDTSLPLELRKPGGMGIAFMRGLMDKMVYSPGAAGGNQLTLIKRCPVTQMDDVLS